MSLRKKTLIIVGVTIIGLIGIPYFMLRDIMWNGVDKLEATRVRHEVKDVEEVIDEDLSTIDTVGRAWATLDDTCVFVDHQNEAYVRENLTQEVVSEARLNVILFFDTTGLLVYKEAVDWRHRVEAPFPDSVGDFVAKNSALVSHPDVNSVKKGVILIPEGALLLVSMPIVRSNGAGPIRGTLLVGRYMDDAEILRWKEKTDTRVITYRLDSPQLPNDLRESNAKLSGSEEVVVRQLDENYIAGYAYLNDINGNRILIIKAIVPREIHQQSMSTIYDFLLYFLPVGAIFGLATLFLLERLVVSRLASMSRSVGAIGASGDPSKRVSLKGSDELAGLAKEINKMLESLEQSAVALCTEKEFSESILDNAINIVLACDRDGNVTFLNRYALELLGYEKHEALGKNWYTTFLPERIRQEKLKSLENFFAGEAHSRVVENPVLCKDGRERHILWSSVRLKDEKGNSTSFMSFGKDITERKAAEEALARETMKLSAIFSSMEEGVVLIDKNDTIVEVNPFFSRLFGMPREELLGKGVEELRDAVTAAELKDYIPVFRNSASHSPVMLERRFGSAQVVFRLQPIYNESDYDGVLLNVLDITALVASRQEAESAYLELEQKVQELQHSRQAMLNMMQDMDEANRVLKETQAQLIQQEKMSCIGTLAAGVAHEFNNILAGMMGFASLAVADQTRVSKLAEIVLREGERAAKIIRSLLSFSRHKEQSLTHADLRAVLDDVLSLTQREFDKINITIETDYSEIPRVLADVGQIEQVLLNMFINARHAMERGGKLKLTVWSADREVLIAIEDTGCGIPPESLPRIFDPFFSTKGVWGKDKPSGTGLGLSVSRNIIEAHRGRIDVKSTEGKGTTFTIHLPAAEGQPVSRPQRVTCRLTRHVKDKYQVLVADDEEVLRELLLEILHKMGHDAKAVSNGEEAIEELRKNTYDYLFLDMMMPGKFEGKHVLEEIKEMRIDTRVFICTGRVEDEHLTQLLRKAHGYVRKPFTADEIAAAINGEPVDDESISATQND